MSTLRRGTPGVAADQLRLLAEAAELMPAPFLVIDSEGRFIAANEMACHQLGYARDDLLRLRVCDVDPLYGEQVWPQMWQEVRDKRQAVVESLHCAQDGREVPVEIVARYLRGTDGREYACAFVRDISTRRDALEKLAASEARVRTLFDALPFIVWSATPDGHCLELNRAWETFTGVPEEAGLGLGWLDYVHPDDAERCRKAFRNAAARSQPYRVQFRLRGRSGEYCWFESRAVPRLDADRSVAGYAGALFDVTERRRHEETLQRIARGLYPADSGAGFFGALVEDAAAILDADCVAVCERVPGNAEEVRSLAVWRDGALGEPIAYRLEDTPCGAVCAGRTWSYPSGVCETFPRDAELRELNAQAYVGVPLQAADGCCLGLIWAVFRRPLEGTETAESLLRILASRAAGELERLRSEQALRASEARLRAIFEQASVGVAHADADTHRILAANRRLCEILGRCEQELVGRSFLEFTHPDDRKQNLAMIERMRRGEVREMRLEKRYVRPDGEIRWVEVTVSPLEPDPAGSHTHIAVVLDVTERKRAEQERLDLEAQLRHAQKMEAIGRLAGGVAHDFNNLLSVIIGNSALLLDELEATPEPVRESVREILQAGRRGAELTHQLLSFGRRHRSHRSVIDAGEILSGAEKLLRRLLDDDIDLRVHPPDGILAVHVDAAQVEQALVNIAVNARDAMPEGGRLTMRAREVQLNEPRTADVRPGRYVVIEVVDTGHGMDEATRARAFEPFFTTKDRGKGTGLGLSTAYATMRNHGGFIELDSRVDEGTIVRVYLPLAESPTVSPAEPAAAKVVGRGKGTILLVEDEDAVRRLAERVLGAQGYRVLSATDPEEALCLSREYDGGIDLLLTDVVMPQMNGARLAEEILARRPGTEVLFMSGYAEATLGERGVSNLGERLLHKPFDPAALLRAVQRTLSPGTAVEVDGAATPSSS